MLIADLPQQFPPLRSLTVIPNNLPILLTEFIGREETIKEIRRALERTRLLTLVGPGGIGKSRLSIETAAQLANQFRHGVFFISLAPISSAESVPQAIAEGIGLSLATNDEPRQQLLNYLRSKQQLLVADNFEHVIDAAQLVDEILRGAPEVKFLVTSRSKLNLSGEAVYPVPGLRVHRGTSPESILNNEAVQLFAATARRSKPDFEISQDDVQPLQKILALVQGSPLAILLAASWVDLLTVDEIAEEIAKDFDFLETEMRNMPDRQRSVRAVFEYSWRLLAKPERELFSALSLFSGGFTRQAAQEVAGASLRQLANLANKSLLSTSPETGRYFVHELLRQYGEKALREDANRYTTTLIARDQFYAQFMDEAWIRLTHDEQLEALLDIEADIENVRTAWRHLVAKGDAADALRMVRSLWIIHEVRGWHVAADEIFGEAVRVAGSRLHSDSLRTLVAMCESVRSWFVALLGRPEAGVALAEHSTNALRELGCSDELAFAYGQMLMSLYLSAQPSRMKRIGQEMLELSDDPWIQAGVHNWLSFTARIEGNFDEEERHLTLAESLIGSIRDYWLLYWWHLSKAISALERGNFATCREILERTLTIVKAINMKRGLHHTLYNLGITASALEDYGSAQAYLLESIRVSEELGGTTDKTSALVDLAITLSATGETEQAVEMAATAFAHPLSAQITTLNSEPVRERAKAVRASLEGAIAPEEAEAAWQRGLSADFDSVVANLIDTSFEGK